MSQKKSIEISLEFTISFRDFVIGFDPPAQGFPYPTKPGDQSRPRRIQKGQAKQVVVFHTSSLGVKENIADIDVIVNDSVHQPGKIF